MEHAAILIAPDGPSGQLRGLMDRLGSAGIEVTIVDDVGTAVELVRKHDSPPALLLDLRDMSGGEIEDLRNSGELIRRVLVAVPSSLPVVVTDGASAQMVITCFRAGAADVIDLGHEGTATSRNVVQRICLRQWDRARELTTFSQQRTMVEDLLKDLIRTERRTIDAEDALAHARSGEVPMVPPAEARGPAILLIEHDRSVADDLADLLETAGIATFAYVTGEEAVREAEALAASTGLDLALVAAQLPGIDGLESIRRLRDRVPGIPAFLMTSVHDADLAADAADLGVVGFVHKPLEDIEGVVERLAQLAHESLHRTREAGYLARIKERHERVLARYRSLPREP
ncbi:MAG: response regulator [Deltaproteobacteria bacterium]|nr:response regulator [Deltaproteobacteria bacterium]